MSPPISVIIATRNYGRYLPITLDSVQSQTFRDFECQIIDDGSTDDTPSAIQPYLSDPRIRYTRMEGLGQARAKNLGVRLTRAPLIAFLDADDVWLPTKLERQYSLFQTKPSLGLVHTRRELMGPDGEPLPYAAPSLPRGQVMDQLVVHNRICFSSTMIRRDVLEHVGLFNESLDLAIDYDLWLRIVPNYEIDFVDDVMMRYRTGHANLSRRVTDRVKVDLSIMRRVLTRWGYGRGVTPRLLREAWASTYRTAGYLWRTCHCWHALKWYARAFPVGQGLWTTTRAMAMTCLLFAHRSLRRALGRYDDG